MAKLSKFIKDFSDLSAELGIGILILCKDLNLVYANLLVEQILNKSSKEIAGLHISQLGRFYDIENNVVSGKSILDQIKTGIIDKQTKILHIELPERGKFSIKMNVSSFYEEDGIYYVLSIKDITRRIAEQDDIERRKEQFNLIFESSPAGLCFFDTEGTVVELNERFASIFDLKKEQLMGLNLVKEMSNLVVREQIEKTLSQRKGFYEGYYTSKISGKTIFIQGHTNPVFGKNNEFIGGLCLIEDLTELNEDKKRIEYLYSHLNGVLESSTDNIFALDKNGNYLFFNANHKEWIKDYYNYSPIGLGVNFYEVIADDEERLAFKSYLEHAFAGNPIGINKEFKLNGKIRHYLISLNPVYVSPEEIVAVSVFMRDNTLETQSLRRIKESEALLSSITSNLSEAVFRVNQQKEILYANVAYYQIFDSNLHPQLEELWSIPELKDLIESTDESNSYIHNFEIKIENTKSKTAGPFWGLLNMTKITVGDQYLFDVVIMDITGKVRNEHQLLQSEESYRNLFENAVEAICVLDKSYKILDVNEAAIKMYGATREEIIGKVPFFLEDFSFNDQKQIKDALKKSFLGIPKSMELISKKKNGELISKRVKLKKGAYFGKEVLIVYMEDVTEGKRLEDERNRMITDLTKQNRDLQHFSYVISHDLRAPVANMLSLSSIFNFDNLDEPTRAKVVDGMRIAAENVDRTIIDLNEILSTRNEIYGMKEPIRFQDLIISVQTSLARQIQQSQASIKYNFDEVESIFSIRSYLQSIFFNLIANSIKFRDPERQLEINVVSKYKPGKVEITFNDNGLGIDLKRYRKKLFDLYQRFHNHVDGKGLGLYLVRTQIEALNGSVEVKSEPGKGSEFCIIFAHE